MSKEGIDQKYLSQASQLEVEFFDIISGELGQHRQLKAGKLLSDFNLAHGEIWNNHEAELIAEGYINYIKIPEPVMDYKAEILKLQDEVEKLRRR